MNELYTPITPDDIDTTQHFWNAFGNCDAEATANWIVKFCQRRGKGWEPFTFDQLEAFYRTKYMDGFRMNGLDSRGFLAETATAPGMLQVTVEFVARCYLASPARVPQEPLLADQQTAEALVALAKKRPA